MNAKYLNKYIRSIYKNINRKIYIISFIIVAILIITLFIYNLIKGDSIKRDKVQNESSYKPKETVITGKDIEEDEYIEDETVIKQFIDNCNNGNIDEAYNLLSDDCKDIIFNNSEDNFIQYYYKEIFETKREWNLQSWISNKNYHTYRVRMIDDIMSTGDYSNSNNYQDYITVYEDGENKFINVKSFISKKSVNKRNEFNEFEISVVSEITYVDYLEYEFSINNKTDKKLLMDTLQYPSDSMYIELTEEKTRSSTSEGLTRIDLIVDGYAQKNIKIKYNKTASNTDYKTKKIYFLNIVKDYDEYLNGFDYNDILKIIIDL